MKKIVVVLCLFAFASGCSVSPTVAEEFYSGNTANEYENAVSLEEGEEPTVRYSSNINDDIYYFKSNYFIIIGNSNFEGVRKYCKNIKEGIEKQARKIKATHVIYSCERLSDRYYEGNSYSWYSYKVYYLVKRPVKSLLGVQWYNITTAERAKTGRNTGVVVDVVFENTPAFFSNLQKGDVIIEINNVDINNIRDAESTVGFIYSNENVGDYNIKFIRNGEVNIIIIKR